MTLTVDQAFQFALAQQQAGQFATAEGIYRQIVAQHPLHADAWYRLGAISLTFGRAEEALEQLSRAIAIAPSRLEFHCDLGVANSALGRTEAAVACFRHVLSVQPALPQIHCNLGNALTALGDFEAAIASYDRALALQPNFAEAHNNLGNVFLRQGRLKEAAAHFHRAATLRPDLAEALCNLGDMLTQLGRAPEAIPWLRRGVELRPNLADAHHLLGNALTADKQHTEAIACYRRAIELRQHFVEAHCNLGAALFHLDRVEEATASFERALALRPACDGALANLGSVALRHGRFDDAERDFRAALAANPQFAEGHWNLSLVLLLRGRFEEGWREHEWRFRTRIPMSMPRDFQQATWDGAPMPGQTLLLHAEQGYGDAIQFIRYLPLVRERAQAGRIVVECQPALTRLLAQFAGPDTVIVARQRWDAAALPPFDRHVPLLSLPLVLGKFDPLTVAGPYLSADTELRAPWRERLGPACGLRVGIAWAGNPEHREDRRRSIPLETLRPLLRCDLATFYSLQIDPRAPSDVDLIDLTTHMRDFADTAALMAELDLVITVDTAAAHLAGALGLPVWLLLPFVPDWRWGLEREETPWYSTMRLFRQPRAGDWESVVQRVVDALRSYPDSPVRAGSQTPAPRSVHLPLVTRPPRAGS